MARRRGSNKQHERLLVAAARGGSRALSGSGCGGPTARAAAAARDFCGRRLAETMVSAGSRGEWTRGSSGRRLHLWSGEWAVPRGRAGVPAVPDSAWGGRALRGRQKQGGGFCVARRRSGCSGASSESAQGLRNPPAEDRRSSDPVRQKRTVRPRLAGYSPTSLQ